MRLSTYPINTLRDVPADAEVVSHQLMLRAGLIRRLAAGLYTWLPLGLRVLRKVEAHRPRGNEPRRRDRAADADGAAGRAVAGIGPLGAVRAGAAAHARTGTSATFCFGPTHEEVITDLARRELKSYRQLPVNFYQIQTKFRDEIRPRFGVMRAREFTDEGRLLLPPRRRRRSSRATRRCTTPTRASSRAWGCDFRAVRADTGQHRRQRLAGIPRARRLRRGCHRLLRRRRLRREPRDGRGGRRRRRRARRRPQRCTTGRTRRTCARSRKLDRVPGDRGVALREDAARRGQRRRRGRAAWCAATTS